MKLAESRRYPLVDERIKDNFTIEYLAKIIIELTKTYGEVANVVNYNTTYVGDGSAVFYPHRVRQGTQPTAAVGELLIWSDSATNKVYLVYNDADEGAHKIELI